MNITGEIRYFLGDGDYAHLKFAESKTSLSIDLVMVPAAHRNKGVGAMLIQRVLLLADSMGKNIFVSARPIGNNSEERLDRLVKYYSRFGFEVTDRGLTVVYMARKARWQSSSNQAV